MELFVSPDGRSGWCGWLAEPNAQKTDGPLPDIASVRDRIRKLTAVGCLAEPVTVWVHAGRYEISQPLEFGPQDACPMAVPE